MKIQIGLGPGPIEDPTPLKKKITVMFERFKRAFVCPPLCREVLTSHAADNKKSTVKTKNSTDVNDENPCPPLLAHRARSIIKES